MIELLSPKENETLSLRSAAHTAFFRDEECRAVADGNLTFKWYELACEGNDRTSPAPVLFRWTAGEPDRGCYALLLSESPDLQNPLSYMTEACEIAVYNLKIGTRYYAAVWQNGAVTPPVSFRTADELPRAIRVRGVPNIRDMGGYAAYGGVVRQGLLYRGGETEQHMHMTKDGMEDFLRLGIKTEFDMRGEAVGLVTHAAPELYGVRRIVVPQMPYHDAFQAPYREAGRAFFSALADPTLYPIYFHCWGGADRTGTFAYLLHALLGVARRHLIDDYELTSLSIWGTRTRNYDRFRLTEEALLAFPGETLREKAERCLLDHFGVTPEEIARIRRILIDSNI